VGDDAVQRQAPLARQPRYGGQVGGLPLGGDAQAGLAQEGGDEGEATAPV
jgi:hypothetical protein